MNAQAFDWKAPDYAAVFAARMRRLAWIREDKTGARLAALKVHYRGQPADFIDDWGVTFDPRNATLRAVPFKLFPKQREWIEWVKARRAAKEPGVTKKSRDGGLSWLAIAYACTVCLFEDDLVIGFGSRKLELVDKLGDPDCLFWKARAFLDALPPEFTGGWNRSKHAPEKLISFPGTGSAIKGEGGDDIGRGGRAAVYFVDESSSLVHPQLTEASLSQTTNCRIDISTPRGLGNPFAVKCMTWPPHRVFTFHWRDDPRKDDAWYQKQVDELDPVTLAQEVDIDFSASLEGVLIPSAWVQSAIDAHTKLGIAPTGQRRGALDVADEGRDANAFAGVYGWLLEVLEEWSGKGDDIYGTVVRAFGLCDANEYPGFKYDADGLGAGCRGDARVINDLRRADGRAALEVTAFRGSEAVYNPEGEDERGRKNKDFFSNQKAQAWWGLRKRFQTTHRAVTASAPFKPDDIISLSPGLALLTKLTGELSQPTYSLNNAGKIVVDKAPDGAKSPNLADGVMIAYSRNSRVPMRINPGALKTV